MLVVAKRVTWTLRPNRPRKTGSRYNDIISCIGKPKGSVTMLQKQLSHSTACDFRQKKHWGSFHRPVAGIRVKNALEPFATNLEQVGNLRCAQVNSAFYPSQDGKLVDYELRGEGLVWLILAVLSVSSHWGSNCSLAPAIDGRVMRPAVGGLRVNGFCYPT